MLCDYLITTKKPNQAFADHVSVLMYVFAIAAFFFSYYNASQKNSFYLFAITGIIISLVVTLYKKRKDGEAFFRFGLLIASLGWFLGPRMNTWMGILYIFAALAEKQVKFPHEICFNKDGITFNTFPKKILRWNEVVNVVMKDGLITIDQKNNKLYQKEVEGEVSMVEEREFNLFCKGFIALK